MSKAKLNWFWDSGGVTSEYSTLLARATTLGYAAPSAAQQAKQNTLIVSLKAAGVFSLLDYLYVFATDGSESFSRLNWKSPSQYEITKVLSPTFASNQGWTGNGSGYLNTNFNPNSNGVNYVLNSASFGVYCYTADAATAGHGCYSGTDFSQVNTFDRYLIINSGVNTQLTIPDKTGLFVINRSASNATQAYRNGSNISSQTTASGAIPNGNHYLLARNSVPSTPTSYSSKTLSMAFAGGSLDATKQADLNTAFSTYISSL